MNNTQSYLDLLGVQELLQAPTQQLEVSAAIKSESIRSSLERSSMVKKNEFKKRSTLPRTIWDPPEDQEQGQKVHLHESGIVYKKIKEEGSGGGGSSSTDSANHLG